MEEELEKIISHANESLNFDKNTLEYTVLERLALASKKLGVEESYQMVHKAFNN